ncbi:MAG: hypothetical protein US60_C0002G0037 [Microgenomates group bacterium GW2011_GWC1_37_8]|uniref:Uncharacterized protein n=1 Tax=Candidatus Woesebacteria bacterium GW2011_GWB1_38_8 TaxID=1618570 RepID=A0A0G0LC66_9BACT|nr:MAG: hypothetical protein US60_C0002G0037 [Microgenomates group bacterium GW2011_GWC1_37_8]KKQ85475.1 MAG: hypothetical protein UT08_C0006G0058 [Candidatus Woesebacteria bacterium GW2011_GWB1_38_8]
MSERKIKSKDASIANVKRLFSNAPDKDTISIEDAFIAWDRPNPEDVEANKAWLSNMLYHLKYHNLLTPVYSFSSGRKKLEKLQLTLEGKKALGRIEGEQNSEIGSITSSKKADESHSFIDVMKIIAKLREDNPEYDITFDVKLKSNGLREEG